MASQKRLSGQSHDFLIAPNVIGQASGHRRGDLDGQVSPVHALQSRKLILSELQRHTSAPDDEFKGGLSRVSRGCRRQGLLH